MQDKYILIWLFLTCITSVVAWEKSYFTAAVYEHPRQGDETSAKPSAIIKENLRWYGKAAKEAKLRGADMIVFPEYGLYYPPDREGLLPYLEMIPNPKSGKANPCDEDFKFMDRPILHTLSCFAQSNEIVIVANMGGFEHCPGQPNCPSDGKLHLNANVAFDKDGTLLARYYKERLFFEEGMDLPPTPQHPFFRTEFGNFAMFINFDIIFGKMAEVGATEGIDAIVLPAFWFNAFPFYTSTQWWQAWAIGTNATLLAANIHMPGYLATGSGIYDGVRGALVSTISHDGVPKLLIARVGKRNKDLSPQAAIIAFSKNGIREWEDGDGEFQATCSYKRIGKSMNIHKDYRCWEEDVSKYTLVRLNSTKDHVEVCHNGMCCHLQYEAKTMDESFYLGVFNGTHNTNDRYYWEEENCFVARCDQLNNVSCSIFPTVSITQFVHLSLSANFSTPHVYPSVVGNQYKLMQYQDWSFIKAASASSLEFRTIAGFPLLMATLKGRVYEKDPPYIR